jgi:hypothetical protein
LAAVAPAASAAKPPPSPTSVVQFSPSATNLTATEGQASAVSVVIARTSSAGAASFNLDAIAGSATSPDYTATWSNPVTMAAGVTSRTLLLYVVNDTVTEPAESMQLKLTNPAVGTQIGKKNTAIVTILDNDPCAPASVNDSSSTEGSAITFTVSLPSPCSLPVQVRWDTSASGDATPSVDYPSPQTGNVAIASGATSATFSVPTTSDTTDEPNQTFSVLLSAPVNTTIADGTGVGTINDDDAAPTVTMSDNPTALEGSNIVYTISLSALSEQNASGTFETWAGNTADPRYAPVVAAPWSIAAGLLTTTVSVPTSNDSSGQPDRVVWGHLASASNATIPLFGLSDWNGTNLGTSDVWSYATLTDDDVLGFESGDLTGWDPYTDGDAPVASASSASAKTGTYSALLGTPDPSCTVYEPAGVSSVYRDVAIPAGTTTLTFWVNEVGDGFYDSQFGQVQPAGGGAALAGIFNDGSASSLGVWVQKTFDLTPYAGQTIRLLFGVYQDNAGCATGMYLDDVSISTV